MVTISDVVAETPDQLEQLTRAALEDVRVPASPLVAALAYGGVIRDPEDRVRAGADILALPQLTASDLKALATALPLGEVDEGCACSFLTSLLDHHALTTEVIVSMFHSHGPALAGMCPELAVSGSLPISVARATAGQYVIRSKTAVNFIDAIAAGANAEVCQELAALLDDGTWEDSLWAAYETTCAILDETVNVPLLDTEWLTALKA